MATAELDYASIIAADPKGWQKRLTPKMTKYIRHTPTPKQTAVLLMDTVEELFYGGAGGGGKSDLILMGALQYVDQPGYAALILRRTFTDLSMPGALIDRSHEWLDDTDAHWNEQKHIWTFPSGAKLAFGYLDNKKAHMRYRSAEFQNISFDELTEFEDEEQYLFLRSRLRRLAGVTIPLRIRSASNPGGPGHEWVKRRFIKGMAKDAVFVPAKLWDNPHIDKEAYASQLGHLPPVMREQILNGDWTVSVGGWVISRAWFKRFMQHSTEAPLRVRSWDLAAAIDGKRTAGVRMARIRACPEDSRAEYTVEHVVKGKWTPGDRDEIIKATAESDAAQFGKRYHVIVLIEQEPGSGGIAQVDALKRKLSGHRVIAVPASRERTPSLFSAKVLRAGPFASSAQVGNVAIVGSDEWNDEYLDELDNFPIGEYADQMDATSMAFNWLAEHTLDAMAPGHGKADEELDRRKSGPPKHLMENQRRANSGNGQLSMRQQLEDMRRY